MSSSPVKRKLQVLTEFDEVLSSALSSLSPPHPPFSATCHLPLATSTCCYYLLLLLLLRDHDVVIGVTIICICITSPSFSPLLAGSWLCLLTSFLWQPGADECESPDGPQVWVGSSPARALLT
eukprot:290334-Hanusia_phi.AAC.1